MINNIKICRYDDCINEVTENRALVCNACRHARRKNKDGDGKIPTCTIHGKLEIEDVYKYDGKYKCKHCKNIRKSESRNKLKQSNWARKRNLMKKFSMTIECYEDMLRKQNYVCKICKKPETALVNSKTNENKTTRRLAIDHCSKTNRIRGLLCIKCNSMIGSSKDSPDILRAGAEYLEF
jgi:hypothetical protein